MKLTDLPQPIAKLVQAGLRAKGFYFGSEKGIPGPMTESAYRRYLASLPDPRPVDPKRVNASKEEMITALVEIARGEVGVREEGGNNRGRKVQEYQDAASWLDGTGWAWCAAFVGWCIDRLAERYALPFATPEGAGAFWYEDWARQQGLRVLDGKSTIKRGDLVIYSFSHIGIAVGDEDRDETFLCVEGNTNDGGSREGDGVYEKRRPKKSIRSIIRLFA